jgi:hypothetical protein
MDNSQVYPTATNVGQYMAPSAWDAPNRFSLSWSYEVPGVNHGKGLAGHVTGRWSISGTTILQSGNPYTVASYNPFIPIKDATGKFIGLDPNSGVTLFDQHLACALRAVGANDVAIIQIEVATRPDGVEDYRCQFSSVHPNIIAKCDTRLVGASTVWG